MDHFAQAQGQVRNKMARPNHLDHWQLRYRRQGIGKKGQGRRTRPGPLDPDLLQVIAHQFTNAHVAIHVRDDFEQEVGRCRQTRPHRLGIQRLVLVAHCRRGHSHRPIVQFSDQGIGAHPQPRTAQIFGETPDLPATGNRRLAVEIHGMGIVAPLRAEPHGDHLAALGVVAKPRRVGHADELIVDQRLIQAQGLRHHGAQLLRVGAISVDEVLGLTKRYGPRGKAGLVKGMAKACWRIVWLSMVATSG